MIRFDTRSELHRGDKCLPTPPPALSSLVRSSARKGSVQLALGLQPATGHCDACQILGGRMNR